MEIDHKIIEYFFIVKDIDESGLFTLNKYNGEIRMISSLDADGSDSNSYTYIVQVSV
jgi:hypothetical protein